jgi:hypothetical protein
MVNGSFTPTIFGLSVKENTAMWMIPLPAVGQAW